MKVGARHLHVHAHMFVCEGSVHCGDGHVSKLGIELCGRGHTWPQPRDPWLQVVPWGRSDATSTLYSALRIKMGGSQGSVSTLRGACQCEGNRKGAMRTGPSSAIPCLGHYHHYSEDAEGQAGKLGF